MCQGTIATDIAICSVPSARRASAVGHARDRVNTDEINRDPVDTGAAVPQGRHAPVVPEGRVWHCSISREVPDNVSLLHLTSRILVAVQLCKRAQILTLKSRPRLRYLVANRFPIRLQSARQAGTGRA